MTLTRTNPRAFTSITIASRRRATSPSPSASPAPELLHLSELSTDTVDGDPPTTEEQRTTTEAAFVFEQSSLYQGNRSLNSQRNPGIQSGRDATGGRLEEAVLPPEDSGTQQDTLTLSVLPGCGSAREGEEAAAPSTPESPGRSGHVSHVHLTLSPKSTSHSLTPLVTSPPMDSGSALTPKELLPVRHRSSASSPDEGVGLASPPEWYRNTEPMRRQAPEREDTCTLYRTSDRLMARSFTASQRAVESPRPQTTQAPGRLSLEHGCRCVCLFLVGRLLINVFNDKVMLRYSADAVFLLKHPRFCGLINQKAARSCFTSLKEKLT